MIKDWKDGAAIFGIIVLALVLMAGEVVCVIQYFSAESTLAAIGWLLLFLVLMIPLAIIGAITS